MASPRVFLAYAPEDSALAVQLGAALQARGAEVQLDDGVIAPTGANVDARLMAQIAACDAYILVLSPATHTSTWMIEATNSAYLLWQQQRLRFFVPVQITALGPDDYAGLLYRNELDQGGVAFQQQFASLNGLAQAPDDIAANLLQALAEGVNDSASQLDWENLRVAGRLPPQEEKAPEERERGITFGGDGKAPRSEPDEDVVSDAPPAPGGAAEPSNEPDWSGLGPGSALPPSAPLPPAPQPAAAPPPPASFPPPAPVTSTPAPKKEAFEAQAVGSADRSAARSTEGALQFSAYHPATLAVGEWQTLLVYTYVAAALGQIQADAATFTELGSRPATSSATASRQVQQGVELRIEPHVPGVAFSPESDAFIWRGDWRRSLFRCQGEVALAGATQAGWIDIYADGLIPIARIDLQLSFRGGADQSLSAIPQGITVTSNLHDRVFISYSHADAEAFAQARETYQKFGIAVLCDDLLAAGDDYEATLARMIDSASVFQLLWSPRSAASIECQKEWKRAINREATERFIKPWFWKKPQAAPPPEFVAHRISFRYQHLKRKWWNPQTW